MKKSLALFLLFPFVVNAQPLTTKPPTDMILSACTNNAPILGAGASTPIKCSPGTLVIASGKALNLSNTLTLAGTDGSTLNVGTGGTLGSNAFTSTAYAPLASPTFTGTVTHPTPFTLGATSVTTTGTQLNYLSAATGTTGTTSTNVVFSTNPTFITPTLGAATATTINKVTITQPTNSSALTIAEGKTFTANSSFTISTGGDNSTLAIAANKTLTVSNTLTFTGTDGISVAFGATGGTVLYSGGALGAASATSLTITGTAGVGFVEFPTQSSPPSAPASGYRDYADTTGRRAWIRQSDGFTRTWDATLTANRVYTLPDASGTLLYSGGPLGSPSTAGTIPAFTVGGTIAGGGNQLNNIIIGTTTPLASFFTTASASTSLTSPLHIGGTGTTGTQLTFQTTTGVGTTDAFVWKRGNNGATVAATLDNTGLGIGTVVADTALTVNANTAATVAVGNVTLLHLVGADSAEGGIYVDTFSAVPRLTLRRSGGSLGSKSAVSSGDVISSLQAAAYDGSGYFGNGNFRFTAAETWSGSAHGTYFSVFTTPNTTTSLVEAIRIQASGGVTIGATITTDPAIGGLQVNGQQFNPNMASDTATADSTVCTATTGGKLLKGSGALGVCLGTSSERYKENIIPMLGGLAEVVLLEPKNFFYKKEWGDNGFREQYGFIAEDVIKILPKLVGLDNENRPNSVDMLAMVPLLVQSIKELKAANDNLIQRIENIEIQRRASR